MMMQNYKFFGFYFWALFCNVETESCCPLIWYFHTLDYEMNAEYLIIDFFGFRVLAFTESFEIQPNF